MLRVSPATVRSLELLFARCCKGRALNKLLAHEKGVEHVDWQRRPLTQNELQYAINDASASLVSARRLLNGPQVMPNSQAAEEPLPAVLPPMPSAAEAARGASSYSELADGAREELAAAAGLGDGDDGNLAAAADTAEAASQEAEEEEGGEEAAAPDFQTRKSVLEAAALMVRRGTSRARQNRSACQRS